MAWLPALLLTSLAQAGDPVLAPLAPSLPMPTVVSVDWTEPNCFTQAPPCGHVPPCADRPFLKSDGAFPNFIGPISNPVLAKDPRALTEARFLFVNNEIPEEHPLDGGNFQAYGLQVRAALTDRLSFIADKDGYASFHPGVGDNFSGWLDIALGFKYALVRDVETQTLVVAGLQYEPPTGEKAVFQGIGEGVLTPFVTIGKEFGCWHAIVNAGYQLGVNDNADSEFYYASLHVDRQMFGWLYPLVEANWFHYTAGGDEGPPREFGELDGLVNLGTQRVAGNDLVTVALGLKAKCCGDCLDIGFAWEKSVTGRMDFLDNRLLVEAIIRY
jgi:hypothetical protein